ncbi:MAG: hypothetical protein JWN48_379 [Myxococcaceae bacterium]|nr:hypothetical protein [Myxococcaceae bacterium]
MNARSAGDRAADPGERGDARSPNLRAGVRGIAVSIVCVMLAGLTMMHQAHAEATLDPTGVFALEGLQASEEPVSLWISRGPADRVWLSSLGHVWSAKLVVQQGRAKLIPDDKKAPAFEFASAHKLQTSARFDEAMVSAPGQTRWSFARVTEPPLSSALASLAAERTFYAVRLENDKAEVDRDELVYCSGLTCVVATNHGSGCAAFYLKGWHGASTEPLLPGDLLLGANIKANDRGRGCSPVPLQSREHFPILAAQFLLRLDAQHRVELMVGLGNGASQTYVAEGVPLDHALVEKFQKWDEEMTSADQGRESERAARVQQSEVALAKLTALWKRAIKNPEDLTQFIEHANTLQPDAWRSDVPSRVNELGSLINRLVRLPNEAAARACFDLYVKHVQPYASESESSSLAMMAADMLVILSRQRDPQLAKQIFSVLGGEKNAEAATDKRLLFNLACYRAVTGNKAALLRTTKRALQLGKPAAEFRADADFAGFLDDKDFAQLLDNQKTLH